MQRYMKRMNDAMSVVGGLGGRNFISNYKNTEIKAKAVVESTQKMMDAAEALNADGNGFTAQDGDDIVALDRSALIKVSSDGGQTYQNVITSKGLDKSTLPIATSTSSGLLASTDKSKIDNLETNSKGLVIEGKDNQKYNLVVEDGKLGIEVAN